MLLTRGWLFKPKFCLSSWYCKWLIRWRNKLGNFLHLKSDLLQFSLNRRSELGLQTLTFTPSFRELKMACTSVDYALKLVGMVQTWDVTWWLNTRSLPTKSVCSVIGFFRTVSTLQGIARFAVSILDFLKISLAWKGSLGIFLKTLLEKCVFCSWSANMVAYGSQFSCPLGMGLFKMTNIWNDSNLEYPAELVWSCRSPVLHRWGRCQQIPYVGCRLDRPQRLPLPNLWENGPK